MPGPTFADEYQRRHEDARPREYLHHPIVRRFVARNRHAPLPRLPTRRPRRLGRRVRCDRAAGRPLPEWLRHRRGPRLSQRITAHYPRCCLRFAAPVPTPPLNIGSGAPGTRGKRGTTRRLTAPRGSANRTRQPRRLAHENSTTLEGGAPEAERACGTYRACEVGATGALRLKTRRAGAPRPGAELATPPDRKPDRGNS